MIKDIFAVLLNRILARGGNLIVLALLARFLSTEDMGVYGLTTMTSYTVVYFASLGLRNSSAFFIAKGLFDEPRIKQTLLYAWPIISTLAFGIMFGISSYNLGHRADPGIIALAASAVIPMMFVYITQGIFLATKNIRAFNQSEIISRYFLLAGVLVSIIVDQVTLAVSLLTFVASQFVSVVYIAARTYNKRSYYFPISTDIFKPLWPMIKQGGVFSLTLAFVTMNSSVSVYFSNLKLGATSTALLFAALKITELVSEAATSAGLVSYSHGVGQNSKRRALYNNLQAAWVLFAVVMVGAVVLFVFSGLIVKIVYGEKYLGAIAALNWLGLSLPFLCYSRVVNSGLCAQGAVTSGMAVQAVAVLINGAICFSIGNSLENVAIGLVVSRVFCFFAYSYCLARMLNVGYARTALPRKKQYVLLKSAALSKFGKFTKRLKR